MGRKNYHFNGSIKSIWGLAKSPELSLEKEDLYNIVFRETGKDSLRQLTQVDINKVCRTLGIMKDAVLNKKTEQRTDKNGQPGT